MTKDFGEDLQRILKNRADIVFGIINGIDYNEFNPLTDPGIPQNYDHNSIEKRAINKEWLQKHFDLEVDNETPIISMTSRIVEQKGFHLLMKIIESLLHLNVQFIIMGNGDKDIINFFEKIKKKSPKKIALTPFTEKLETSIYAGSDMFLLPSRFEPCGLNQMIAMRYGCIPIVNKVGGLADTVANYNPKRRRAQGFVFKRYDPQDLLISVVRALETYKYKDVWRRLIKMSMKKASSWEIPAQKYISLYRKAMRSKLTPN